MAERNFPDFLSAYFDYARDGFCPDRFHRWIGLSILSAAIERKVSLRQGMIYHIPNLYVMLVSHPAVGKTTAMDRGVDLLEGLKKDHNVDFKIIPNQATEPALVDAMRITNYFSLLDGRIQIPHSSGFFYASEASASALQNVCGDFVASMTAFYDCPKFFRKITKKDGEITIENICMSMLAGSTFNYLKELVNEKSVMGGFASRLLYVVSKERKVREIKWGQAFDRDDEFRRKLIEDLARINKIAGPMKPTEGFIQAYEKWQPEFDQFLISLKSERHESILSRKGTNLIKIAMILSISEGDSLVVTEEHFERAKEMVDEVTEDNSFIISQALIANKDSQEGINEMIRVAFEQKPEMTPSEVRRELLRNGNESVKASFTVDEMIKAGVIVPTSNGSGKYKIKSD